MKKLFLFTVLILLFSVIFNSCKDDEPTKSEENNPPTYEDEGIIGSTGGKVQVTDSNSPIKGSFVEIPEDALESATTITVNEVSETMYFEEDSTGIFVEFGPNNTQFKEPVTIGIPYNDATNRGNLKVYYFDENETVWKSLPTVGIDTQNKIIKAETNHFSIFTAEDSNVEFDIELYKTTNNRIAASVNLLTGLNQIPTGLITYAATGAGNIEQLIKQQPFNVNSAYKVILKKNVSFWFDPEIETKFIIYEINSTDGVSTYRIRVRDLNNNTIFTSPDYQSYSVVEDYYSGKPCLFLFDTELESDAEYYIETELYFTDENLMYGGLWGNHGYYVTNYDESKKLSEMDNAHDRDGDGIVNDYDIGTSPTVNIT